MAGELCSYCGCDAELYPGKKYCKDCHKHCFRECKRCHLPYNDVVHFALHDERCNSCQRKHMREANNRKAGNVQKKSEDAIEAILPNVRPDDSSKSLKKKKKSNRNEIISPYSDDDEDDDEDVADEEENEEQKTGHGVQSVRKRKIEVDDDEDEEEDDDDDGDDDGEDDEEETRRPTKDTVELGSESIPSTKSSKCVDKTNKPKTQHKKKKKIRTQEPKVRAKMNNKKDKEVKEILLKSILAYSALTSSRRKDNKVKVEVYF